MNSCLYQGRVTHRRRGPVEHSFGFNLFMVYLDLEELPGILATSRLCSDAGPALIRFRRSDYPGDPSSGLDDSIRDLVEAETGRRPDGPIRLLTNLRYFGFGFNPVTFFYCFDSEGKNIDWVLAHVTNTPWGETHSYVLEPSKSPNGCVEARVDKQFHVSPFMPMNLTHAFRLGVPGPRLSVRLDDLKNGEKVFSAGLSMRRRRLTDTALAWMLIRYPFLTLRVVLAIYVQAFLLYLKRAPFYPHPKSVEPQTKELSDDFVSHQHAGR